jgi:zinc protease
LYLWATVADGQTLRAVEEVTLAEIDRFVREGISESELAMARAQLRARFVYDSDSVTDIAHQLGYFEMIDRWQTYTELLLRLASVTMDQVNQAARTYLTADNRTIGWFEPCR